MEGSLSPADVAVLSGNHNGNGYGFGDGGARGNYRGEEALDGVYEAYRAYSESGSYGTQDNMQKIEMMTDSLMDFVNHVKKIAKTPEERQFIDRKIQELSDM